ncbi:hypothetical protein, partial [Pseudomonas syringae]|uniref:hypothetical protein n=1 Tax=Pseudomonas syringae TaxID=317 RepID=UPI001C7FBC41
MEIIDDLSIKPLRVGLQTTFLKNMIPFRNELLIISSQKSHYIGNYWNDPVILFRLRALPDVCLDKPTMITRSRGQTDERTHQRIHFVCP